MDKQPVAEVDQLLDELERLATSDASSSVFFTKLLGRVSFLLKCDSAVFMIPTAELGWNALAASGQVNSKQFADFTGKYQTVLAADNSLWSKERRWLAVSLRTNSWAKGALWLCFANPVPDVALDEVVELAQAFGEILALRQLADQEVFLDQKWNRLQQVIGLVSAGKSIEQAGFELVNGLPEILGAARVSVVQRRSLSRSRIVAISGVATISRRSETVKKIQEVCMPAFRTGKPAVQQADPSEAKPDKDMDDEKATELLLDNYVAVPLMSPQNRDRQKRRPETVLLTEWKDRESFLRNVPMLNHTLPVLAVCWDQHQRWLRLPGFLRGSAMGTSWLTSGAASWLVWRLMLIGLVAVSIGLLCRPTELRIEAGGTIQPTGQRLVYVTMDGFVEQLLISDGQEVDEGQEVARLRSPELEQEIQDILAELDQLREKRESLGIEINQLAPDDPNFAKIQNRLSAEIRLLDSQEQNLKRKREFYSEQELKLVIRAPTAGTVVGREIQRYLDGRPVRRGDALFRIVDFSGSWRLELQLADNDYGLVSRSDLLPGNSTGDSSTVEREIDYVLASQPDVWRKATVTWVSAGTRNPDGSGAFVDIHCELEKTKSPGIQMGATVYGYFSVGKQPFWFVWSRGIVESLQRRMWF